MDDTIIYDAATIAMDPAYEYKITATLKETKKRDYPFFKAVGCETIYRGKQQGYPFLEVLLDLSKPEQTFLKLVLARLNLVDNMAHVPKNLLPTWNPPKFSQVYKQLHQRGLIKRTAMNYYMLNPNAMFNPKNYPHANAMWENLP